MNSRKLKMVFNGIYRFENDETVVIVDLSQFIPKMYVSGKIDSLLLTEITEEILEIRNELMKYYLN